MSIPRVRIFEYNIDEIASPVGTRNVPGGSFAFVQMVGSGAIKADPRRPGSTSGTLWYKNIEYNFTEEATQNSTKDYIESKVSVLLFNIGSSGSVISEMKLFLTEDSALGASISYGYGSGFVQIANSGTWNYQGTLPSGAGNRLTRSVPINPNVFRSDNQLGLYTARPETNTSQFVYTNLILPKGYPLGTFGICGSGNLRFGLIFSYWSNDYIIEFGEEPTIF
jgi:hypothetical protein